MSAKQQLRFTPGVLGYPLMILFVIWLVFWTEVRFGLNFSKWGVFPQTLKGLRGVLFSPFIHSSLKHLFNNSIPFLVLTMSLFYFYRSIRWKVLLYGALASGMLTWLIARPAYHIGASGVVYMLAAFLIFKGIFSKQYQLTALSFVVVFLYGSLIWYLFPIDPEISWEGHLSGFAVGIFFALIFRKNPIENKKFVWERDDYDPSEDEFLKHFDEDGNFIESQPDIEVEEVPSEVKINYIIKKDPPEGETL